MHWKKKANERRHSLLRVVFNFLGAIFKKEKKVYLRKVWLFLRRGKTVSLAVTQPFLRL